MTEADGADGAKDTPPTAAAVVWVGGRRLMKLMKLIELTKLTKAGQSRWWWQCCQWCQQCQWCQPAVSSRATSTDADRCVDDFRDRMVSSERKSDVAGASSRDTSADGDGWMWCEAVWCGAVVSAGCVEQSCLHRRRQKRAQLPNQNRELRAHVRCDCCVKQSHFRRRRWMDVV
jgi:hypothetical protein